MHPAFARRDHRPWPLPARPWCGRQSWCDLLFAHWPLPVEVLRALVPAPLRVQEFAGSAWLGVVPFRMRDVMLRGVPALPWISAFAELNVRTYVEHGGKPGVWFLSLDATNPLAVWGGRKLFHLPYERAAIDIVTAASEFSYRLQRADTRVRFDASYAPASEVYEAQPGTLEHFLTERYCLYARTPSGSVYRTDVHHLPWPLQRARAEIRCNTMAGAHGITLPNDPPLLHFAARVDVAIWAPERAG
jgi:uncharacterized protein